MNKLLMDARTDSGPSKNIFEAAEKGDVKFITKLVERTVEFDINVRDNIQRTALHWAAELGRIPAAEALLDYGASVEAAECNGRTAIHLAARSADAAMLKVLLEATSEEMKVQLVNQTDNFGITPVFLALQKGEEGKAAFEFLMSCGGKYNEARVS